MHIIRSDLDNIYIHITFSVVHELLLALEGFIMLPIAFVFKVVSVTSSGVLSPGPLTASTVAVGTKDGARAGLLVSIGHTIVEFPLVILIALGITIIFTNELATRIISLLGAGMLFFLSYLMLKDIIKKNHNLRDREKSINKNLLRSPLMIGITLSLFNPYFIVWWIFVGGALAVEAYAIAGFMGVILMFFVHIWMDYVFLIAVAYAAYKGKEIIKSKGYRVLLTIIVIFLIVFGIDLLFNGLFKIRLISF